jgi:hypothetical protein
MISRQLVSDTIAKEGSGAQWDALLSERTSALRLAQSLGADFVVLASLSSVTREERTFNDGTLQLTSHNHVLRVAYRIAEAGEGGTLVGDTIRVSRNIRGTQTAGIESTEIFNQLVDDAVSGLLKAFPAKVVQVAKTEVSKAAWIEVGIAAVPVDLTQNPLQLPDLRVGADGSVAKTAAGAVDVVLGDVSIEIDGVLVGTTPATLRLAPGFHFCCTRPCPGLLCLCRHACLPALKRPSLIRFCAAVALRRSCNSASYRSTMRHHKKACKHVFLLHSGALPIEYGPREIG